MRTQFIFSDQNRNVDCRKPQGEYFISYFKIIAVCMCSVRRTTRRSGWSLPWVLAAVLGNSVFTRFGCATSKACLLFLDITLSGGAVTSWCRMCTGHVTFCYKRSVDALFKALFSSFGSWFILQVCPCHPHKAGVQRI